MVGGDVDGGDVVGGIVVGVGPLDTMIVTDEPWARRVPPVGSVPITAPSGTLEECWVCCEVV